MYTVENNQIKAIEVIKHAGECLKQSGKDVSYWWDPKNLSASFFNDFSKPEEFYVMVKDGKTAGAVILQTEQTLQDWSSVDGVGLVNRSRAVYVHYLAVEREFAGKGISQMLLDFAKKLTREKNRYLIRLDTNADEPKLKELYEGYGFKAVGELDEEDGHRTVLYEMYLKEA